MVNDKGNGHDKTLAEMAKSKAAEKAFDGATVYLEDLQRQDGIMAQELAKGSQRQLGVIQTLLTHDDDESIRQALVRARWKNEEHRRKFVNAIAQCRLTGAIGAMKWLMDMIDADRAGDNGALIHEAIEGITHTTFTSQEIMNRKKGRNNGDYRKNNTSPLA